MRWSEEDQRGRGERRQVVVVEREPDSLFACLRQSEAIELCQTLAAKHNGDLAKIEAEFRKSSLYDPETAHAVIQAGIDAWFNC